MAETEHGQTLNPQLNWGYREIEWVILLFPYPINQVTSSFLPFGKGRLREILSIKMVGNNKVDSPIFVFFSHSFSRRPSFPFL